MGRQPVDQNSKIRINPKDYPDVIGFLHRPVLYEPPLCQLYQLQDGTYSFSDLILMNELMDYKDELKAKAAKSK